MTFVCARTVPSFFFKHRECHPVLFVFFDLLLFSNDGQKKKKKKKKKKKGGTPCA